MNCIYNNIKNLLIQRKIEESSSNICVDDITMSFYEACLEKLVHKFGKIPGILAIYQFGSVGAVGNSDIDLIFVIEPDKDISRRIFWTFENEFSSKEKYILYQHPPCIIGEEIIENINYVRKCENIKLLYGQKYTFNNVNDILISLYMLIDLITEYYPFVFLGGKLPARAEFQYVNAFGHIYSLFRAVFKQYGMLINSLELKEVEAILYKNDQYRREYKDRCDIKVREFFYYAEKRIMEILEGMNLAIDSLLERQLYVNNKLPKDKYVIGQRIFTRFYQCLCCTVDFFGRKITYGQYPLSYLLFFRFKTFLPANLLKAIKKRDFYVDLYVNFIKNFALGRSLYYPWWKTNNWKTVVKQLIKTVDVFKSTEGLKARL